MFKLQRQRVKRCRSIRILVDFVRIYGSTRLRLLFEQPECDHAWNLMQRQETNVNEANAFRWRMRVRSAVCTAVTCDFNPLTFTKTGIIFLIKKDIKKEPREIYFSFNLKKKTFQNSSSRIIIQFKLSFQKETGRNISIYFFTKAFLSLIINNCLLKILFH